jgi:hypothetical protein
MTTQTDRGVDVKEILVVLICVDGTTETIPATSVTWKDKYAYDYPMYTVSANA